MLPPHDNHQAKLTKHIEGLPAVPPKGTAHGARRAPEAIGESRRFHGQRDRTCVLQRAKDNMVKPHGRLVLVD